MKESIILIIEGGINKDEESIEQCRKMYNIVVEKKYVGGFDYNSNKAKKYLNDLKASRFIIV